MDRMKKAYLTIDDSPSEDFTRKINILKENDIPAIFFCIGEKIKGNKNQVIQAIENGFIIGNHSWSHKRFSNASVKDCKREIKNTDKIIDKMYVKADVERKFKVFRFPYLDSGAGSVIEKENYWQIDKVIKIQKILQDLDYEQPNFENINYKWWKENGLDKCRDIHCTFDTRDWKLNEKKSDYNNLEDLIKTMDRNEPEKGFGLNYNESNDIVMMHDHYHIKHIFLPLLEKIKQKGIEFANFK